MFTLASVACGLAGDQVVLIVARFAQGVGGAVASAAVLALLVTEFPRPSERAIAMSVYTFILAGGGSLGLLAGGVLTQSVDWHWIFFINVPIGIVTFALGSVLINETERLGLGHGVDVAGAVLVTAALMLGVYAIVKVTDYGWLSAHTLGFGAAAMTLLAVFVAVESRISDPMFPLRILRVRGLAGSSVVRGFVGTGMYSTFLLGVLYLQHVHGYGALQTGLAFLPLTLTIGLFSLGVTARLMRRFGATSRRARRAGRDRRRARAAVATAGARKLLPHDRAAVRAARPRRGAVVPAADHDRDGRRADRRRRPGLRNPQRLAADLGGDRDRGAGHHRGRSARRCWPAWDSTTSRRSPAAFTSAGRSPPAPSAWAHSSRCCRCARGGGPRRSSPTATASRSSSSWRRRDETDWIRDRLGVE